MSEHELTICEAYAGSPAPPKTNKNNQTKHIKQRKGKIKLFSAGEQVRAYCIIALTTKFFWAS